jgi:hypothetical protein
VSGTTQQRHARPDEAALAKALAARSGVSQAKAQAALDAAHGDRDDHADALAAALAKELGLDAAKVKAPRSRRSAPEARRRPRRTRRRGRTGREGPLRSLVVQRVQHVEPRGPAGRHDGGR